MKKLLFLVFFAIFGATVAPCLAEDTTVIRETVVVEQSSPAIPLYLLLLHFLADIFRPLSPVPHPHPFHPPHPLPPAPHPHPHPPAPHPHPFHPPFHPHH